MTDVFIERYCAFFESLGPQRLDDIDKLFHPDALFRDPFNHVRGRAAIRRIFEHLLQEYPRTRFRVLEAVPGALSAYIRWTFKPDTDKPLEIEGLSRVVFDVHGAVIEHRDYWDSASELFARLPLTGPPTRWLLRQAQACAADQVD
jgi:hypothetical protein